VQEERDSAAVDFVLTADAESRRPSPPRAEAGTAACPIEVGSDSDDPRLLVVDEAAVESTTEAEGVSALDTLVDLAVTKRRSTTHQVVIPPPGLLVPTARLVPVAPRCPAMPVPPRPWLLTTINRPSDGRGIRIFTPSVQYYHKRSDPRHRWR